MADSPAWLEAVDAQPLDIPERKLFPFVLPVLAWASLAVEDPSWQDQARARMAPLLDALLPETARVVGAPGGQLSALEDYRRHATWLGWTALALGAWRMSGGDDRYKASHDRLIDVLAAGMETTAGAPLESYPGLVWPVDTVPVALALKLHGDPGHVELIEAHLAWQDAHVDELGLPPSMVVPGTWEAVAPPRGCDLSLRITLLAQLDPARAEALYQGYASRFWVERAGLAGFGEWEGGAPRGADHDSGPVVLGMGTAATGFGLGAARAVGDAEREARLRAQLGQLEALEPMLVAMAGGEMERLGFDPEGTWTTGSPLGDAALLWSVTWVRWPLD